MTDLHAMFKDHLFIKREKVMIALQICEREYYALIEEGKLIPATDQETGQRLRPSRITRDSMLKYFISITPASK